MDGQIPNPPNAGQTQQTPSGGLTSSPIPPNEKPEGNHSPVSNDTRKGLLFEIIFVVVFLVIFFGILNYFNILRLSEIFPNYLGFLPRRDVPTGTSQQPASPQGGFNNLTIVPNYFFLST